MDLHRREDDRGFFARSFCESQFGAHGLPTRFPQCNVSFNIRRGTLRGMHYQADPSPEGKLVRCTRGAIFDVVLDIRPGSPTYCKWLGFELSEKNGTALYLAEGLAHGFQTLRAGAEVLYYMSAPYQAGLGRGVRWNDKAFGIEWPIASPLLSERDQTFTDFVR